MSQENWKAPEIARLTEIHNGSKPGGMRHTAADWDARAAAWEDDLWHENMQGAQAQERVRATTAFLTSTGALNKESHVIDVGCGPGQFVTAFGKECCEAMGIDISPKIVALGEEYAKSQGVENTRFLAADFLALDLDESHLRGAFDLAFCSITPAIRGITGLEKFISLSRAWCCSGHFLRNSDDLFDEIAADVFPSLLTDRWDGKFFYTTLNLLLLNGFLPQTHYYTWRKEVALKADERLADKALGTVLSPKDQTAENKAKILSWLLRHADKNGQILTKPVQTYGWLLWHVQQKVR